MWDSPAIKKAIRPGRWVCAITLLMGLIACAPEPRQPNLLILYSDDQRADAIGAYGNPHIETPNLDALVERGFSFRQAYVMGSHHGAICAPSRAMLMTGRSLFHVYGNLDTLDTFPMRLQDAGYRTFGTGKWHQSQPSFAKSFEEGRNVFFGGMNDHFQTHVRDKQTDSTFTEPEAQSFSTTLFADAAIAFIEQQATADDNSPFLAYVAFTAPHDPRTAPGDYATYYDPEDLPLPPNFKSAHPFDLGPMSMAVRDEHLAAWPRTPEVIQSQLADYYGLITHMDAEIGRIFEALRETGQWDDTIIVFAADNGLAMGSHGLLGKQSLYEHSFRVPLIMAGPSIPQGASDALTYLYDLTPTLLELAGAPSLPRMDGKNLAPIWKGERTQVRETLFTAYHDAIRAVRDDTWKLIRYPHLHHTQLFNLREDPHEINNRADDSEQQARVAAMMELLEVWQAEMDDPHPLTAEERRPMAFDYTQIERKPDRWQPSSVIERYFSDL